VRSTPLILIMILALSGCTDALDAQDYEHNRDYDRYSITVDSGNIIVRNANGRGSTRGVAQYEGAVPTVRVEVVDRVLEIEGVCGERTTDCWVDFFVDAQTASPGSIDVGKGTVQVQGMAGDHTVDVTDGTLDGEELLMGLFIGRSSADLDVQFDGFPTDLSLDSSAGDIVARVPTGAYALDLSAGGDVTTDGITEDPTSDKSIRATASVGTVTLTGN
jgi:hypothetical protein